jgi:type III secretion system FlhB-like substrate exporter
MDTDNRKTVKRMTRAQIKETLYKTPIEQILGTKQPLTHKQREFARKVALGTMSKRQAYKETYNVGYEPSLNSAPYVLARDQRIAKEIEAYRLAIEAEKLREPAQLKALLVQQLVQHSLDSEFPPAQRMKALELIGKLYEVGAFVELKETTVINKKSEDIKAQLIERIKEVIDVEAKPSRDGARSLQDEIENPDSANTDATAGAPTAIMDAHGLS